jgi:hypothetical protein
MQRLDTPTTQPERRILQVWRKAALVADVADVSRETLQAFMPINVTAVHASKCTVAITGSTAIGQTLERISHSRPPIGNSEWLPLD